MFTVEFYEKKDRTVPVEDFIMSLSDKLKTKVFRDLKLLQEFGNEIREPQSKKVSEDGLFELRTKQGSDIVRVFYFFVINKKIILTNGYVKKKNKVSRKDLDLAKEYKKDYIERFGGK